MLDQQLRDNERNRQAKLTFDQQILEMNVEIPYDEKLKRVRTALQEVKVEIRNCDCQPTEGDE